MSRSATFSHYIHVHSKVGPVCRFSVLITLLWLWKCLINLIKNSLALRSMTVHALMTIDTTCGASRSTPLNCALSLASGNSRNTNHCSIARGSIENLGSSKTLRPATGTMIQESIMTSRLKHICPIMTTSEVFTYNQQLV